MVNRFNAIAARGDLVFEAWFSEVRQPDRSWDVDPAKWRFKARYLVPRDIARRRFYLPFAELDEVRPDVFVLEYDRFNLALGAIAGTAVAGRCALRVLPNYDAWSERSWWRELSKHVLFRGIDGAKVPGPDGRQLAVRYGLSSHRQSVVRQSVDVAHYAGARQMSSQKRQAARSALGLRGCTFLFVGRVWSGKGVGELLDAYRLVAAAHEDVSLLIVGDGVDSGRYRCQAKDLPRVVFAGFVQPAELPGYYALGDVLVFPTHGDPNGLVVEEAMAAGLPVITTTAAGDITSRVPEGVVGHVVGVGDVPALAACMEHLVSDDVRAKMSQAAMSKVVDKTDAGYAEDFGDFIDDMLALPKRSTAAARILHLAGGLLVWMARRRKWRPAPYVS